MTTNQLGGSARLRYFATLSVGLLGLWAVAGTTGAGVEPTLPSPTLVAFLSRPPSAPVMNRAHRRLEAVNTRHNRAGWLEAVTWVDEGGFGYAITAEGGSGLIRGRVLKAALEAEARAFSGDGSGNALTAANYTIEEEGETEEGYVRLRLTPRRKEQMLINGYVIVTKGDARVVRVEGRLVKNPSFWTTHVDVARTYEVIDGHNMPVVLQSHAELRMFGDSEFRMTIRYDTIEGQATTGIGPTGEPGPGES